MILSDIFLISISFVNFLFTEDGYLDYKEFENMIADYINQQTTEENAARAIYQEMDADGDGKVTVSEIVKALKISKKEAKELIAEADKDNDGKMSFEGKYYLKIIEN